MSPEQIEVESKAFDAEAIAGLNSAEYAVAWVFWLARAEKAQRVREALEHYMAAFGQDLVLKGIPYDKQQQEADAAARAALKD